MERLPRIVMILVATTAIFLWLSSAFTSCGNKDLDNSADVLVTETIDDSDEFADDLGEDIFGSSDDTDSDAFYTEDEDEDMYIADEEEDVETDFTTPPSASSSSSTYSSSTPKTRYKPAPTPAKTARATYSSDGQYMVIAGNYLVKTNANEMIRKLANLGYGSAEIGVFERSQYHTVIASRHSSNSSALQTANALKNRGVDCYVKRKTY